MFLRIDHAECKRMHKRKFRFGEGRGDSSVQRK